MLPMPMREQAETGLKGVLPSAHGNRDYNPEMAPARGKRLPFFNLAPGASNALRWHGSPFTHAWHPPEDLS